MTVILLHPDKRSAVDISACQRAYDDACMAYLYALFLSDSPADYRYLQQLATAVFRARAELRGWP